MPAGESLYVEMSSAYALAGVRATGPGCWLRWANPALRLSSASKSGSMVMTNKRGAMGSPCGTERDGLTPSLRPNAVRNLSSVLESREVMRRMKGKGTDSRRSACVKASHDTRS